MGIVNPKPSGAAKPRKGVYMKKVATVGKFYIYKFEPDEEVEKGCIYGVIEKERAERTEYLDSSDMDFHEKTETAAIRRALSWN